MKTRGRSGVTLLPSHLPTHVALRMLYIVLYINSTLIGAQLCCAAMVLVTNGLGRVWEYRDDKTNTTPVTAGKIPHTHTIMICRSLWIL